MKVIIVQGSARSEGNTNQIARIFQKELGGKIIDLNKRTINSYSYDHTYEEDDFLGTIREVLENEMIIFLTPVYWYSMSGIMKNFFDRITDCLKIDKETGRKFRGKKMIAISCGSDEIETLGFFEPFKKSAQYLGMDYLGDIHTWIENEVPNQNVVDKIESFIKQIKNN
jgi:multimeric flavodoxin WrbA